MISASFPFPSSQFRAPRQSLDPGFRVFGPEIWVPGALGKRVIRVQNLEKSVNFFLAFCILLLIFIAEEKQLNMLCYNP